MTIVATERLKLREFAEDDLDELARMVGDEEQLTFYPRPKTREEALAWLDRNRAFYDEYGYGFWCLESRLTAEFVGYCGIRPLELDSVAETEIGWHVRKTLWNKGLASEAALAARDIALEHFRLSGLVAIIHVDHVASQRVAEKIGMRAERATMIEGDYPALIFRTSASGRARRH
jgi:RimJ/RimL family protein N-acetyltransferase